MESGPSFNLRFPMSDPVYYPNPDARTPWGAPYGFPIKTDFNIHKLPVNDGGYTALRQDKTEPPSIQDYELLRAEGWRLLEWNGTDSRPLLDRNNKVFGLLAGRPIDPSWEEACKTMVDLMNKEGSAPAFQQKEDPLRGAFPAINAGVHHSGGTSEPENMVLKSLRDPMHRILSSPAVQAIAKWQDTAFSYWAPRLYNFYDETLKQLWSRPRPEDKEPLRPTFPSISVWPTAAFNFGPNVWCLPHRDIMDLSFGWCSILALGSFNPSLGGHLILPDLRIIIPFPPGSTIMIPSATLVHANTPVAVADGESRISFTQYGPGGLFRWVHYGFLTQDSLRGSNPRKYREVQERQKRQWEEGLNMFSHIDEFPYHLA